MASSQEWKEREYLVGINYFAGWWRELPNKWHHKGEDWRPEYPGRVPILGEYNEQETMDKEILAASEHGVDFFQILWYPMDNDNEMEPHAEHLNVAVDQFMASPYSSRMRFTIENCNHPPFSIDTDEKWESTCRYWCKAMSHPSYLHVAGRPIFKIHWGDGFYIQNGNDPAKMKSQLDTLRGVAHEFGLEDPLIGAMNIFDENNPTADQFDWYNIYMEVPEIPMREELYPYSELLNNAEKRWLDNATEESKQFMPCVPAGWDPRPWHDQRPSFEMPNREQWIEALNRVKTDLDKYPKLGLPDGKGGRKKAFTIYAWNEFGEGGIMAPTKGDGYMKLEGIKEVFGAPSMSEK